MAPLRLVSPVLRQMLPLVGARCLGYLDDTETAGLLRGVGAQAGVALLRQFGAERRARLLAQLPVTLTIAYELLLGYPEDTVGAWMDPHALALPDDMTSGDSLERVRRTDDASVADPYVINRNQRLMGYVELADLLRTKAATPLARLVRSSPHRLPAQSQLAGLRIIRGGASPLLCPSWIAVSGWSVRLPMPRCSGRFPWSRVRRYRAARKIRSLALLALTGSEFPH